MNRLMKQEKTGRHTGKPFIHPAWIALIRHCQEMGYGEIERVKIQDGVPVMVEQSIKRLKLT